LRWEVLADAPGADVLRRELGVHPVVATVLCRRGLSEPSAARSFLHPRLADLPDPRLLLGMDAAVARLVRALEAGERICAYGDYDVDGTTATAVLVSFLRAVGGRVDWYVPRRLDEGYGLNVPAIERIAEAPGAPGVLVALDCGITSVAEVDRANALGLEVVIVDHHAVPETLPRAAAILDPWQPGCRYPTKHLAAVGLAFLLVVGLRRALRERGCFASRPEPDLRAYLDLVALGTVADVVPLTGVNRILVKAGLLELGRGTRCGVRALKRVAGLEPDAPVSAGQVGFRLAPRVNAAGRMGDAARAVELFLADDPARADALARELDAANLERQAIEREVLDRALAVTARRPDLRGLVLDGAGWHPGVVGIVASRIVDRLHRPTIVVAVDPETGVGKGSGRSIEGFHLHEAIASCAEHLVRFGGHRQAAGITVERDRLPAFREAFEREAAARLGPDDLIPRCRIDAALAPEQVTFALAEAFSALQPFGAGNPEPVLALRGLRARPRTVGEDGGHLKLALDEAPFLDAIGFGMGHLAAALPPRVDLAFQLGVDEFRGERRLKLRLKDVKGAE
jgi:single-stranded-DNA-specific exonuclease